MVSPHSLLRKRLQEVAKAPIASHPQLITELATQIPHSIVLVTDGPCVPADPYNCFEFSLGIAGRPEVFLISECFQFTFCDCEFVLQLVESVLIPTASPSTGDLVLYRTHEQIKHAGLLAAGRIISKWGEGHLWLHGLLEVPASYGDATSFYKAPCPPAMLVRFIEFARQREGHELVNSILDGMDRRTSGCSGPTSPTAEP